MKAQVNDALQAFFETLCAELAAKISHLNFTAVLRQ